MIKSFKNNGTEDIFNGKNTKDARRICPRRLSGNGLGEMYGLA
jgi:proteic killer suppression protein